MAENSNKEITLDLFPFIREYKDGSFERFMGKELIPPSPMDPETGVQSKDVVIEPEINVGARLFLPKNPDPARKLPILVYFHGGGFVVESAFSPLYHRHLNLLVAEANVIAVSVNYRLAPEHPLPAAYEDSWLSLKWVSSQSEEWLKDFADLNSLYLGGDSAGANIAHHMAIRLAGEKLDGINLRGVFLNCPFFWGKDPIGSEVEYYKQPNSSLIDNLWRYVCPGTSGSDDPWFNPGSDPKVSGFGCQRVLVYLGGKDVLKERGWYYKEVLGKSGWGGEVEVVEVEGEEHVFSVSSPTRENSVAMFKRVASFLNHH